MRVGINVLQQSPRVFTGSLSQFLQMGDMLPHVDPETKYTLLAGGADVDYYRQRTRIDQVVDAGLSDRGTLLRLASEHVLLGRACARHDVDVLFHQSAGAVPLMLPARTKVVLGVWGAQDPSSIALPLAKRLYRKLLAEQGLARTAHLILNSNYTRELVEARHTIEVPATVIHHGVDERLFHPTSDTAADQRAVRSLGLDRPYVLFVGQAYPYKLLHVLVEAFARAAIDRRFPHQLAIVASFNKQHNPEGEAYREQLLAILDSHGLRERAVFLEGIPVSGLRALYAASDLYVQSSASETFGRTVIEAMACGAPVLAARAAATPEVLGEAGRYYEPHDVDGCAEGIATILEDTTVREALRIAGAARVKLFSRIDEMRSMANVFREVGGQPPLPA
jgi:glycosyltransferase involved in cell wall biosynthesis